METISKKLAEAILCSHCNEVMSDEPCEPSECEWLNEIRNSIGIDAVEVVRCEDCAHWQSGKIGWCEINSSYDMDGMTWNAYNENDFCSYGEKDDDQD